MIATLLRIAMAAALALGGIGLLAEGRQLGILRSRPMFLLVAVPVALLCLWGFRRAKPGDRP